MDFENAHPFPLSDKRLRRFLRRLRAGPHEYEHTLRVRCSGIIEQVILPTR